MLNRSADTPFRAFEKRVLFRSLSEARVLSAIQQLMETLSGVSRQTIDPKALDAGLNRIAADFAAIHQVAGDLVFEELQSNLKVCDRLLSISAQNQDFVRGLIFLMLQRNVRRFVFTEGVTTAEIGELIRLLSYPDDGDLPTAIARAGLSHIEAQDQVEAHSPYDDIFSTFATLDERIDAVSTEFRIPAFDQPPADDEDAIKTISNLVDEAEAVPYTVGGDVDDEDDGFDEDEPDAGEPERVEDAAGEPIEPGAAPRSALDGDLNDMIELGDFGSEDEQLLHESGGEDPAPDDFERRADSARIENEPTTPFGPPLDTMGDSEVPADGIDAPPDFDWEPSMEADAVSEPDAPLEDGDEPVVSADALDAMEFEDVDDAGDLPATARSRTRQTDLHHRGRDPGGG